MPYTAIPFNARVTAFQGMGMMPSAFTRANRAMGARMITTITTAAT